ncbi:unnamed protein product, partial [Meganyctiphanes norvegica]
YSQAKVHVRSKKVTLTAHGITAPPCYNECGIVFDWVCGTDDKNYQNPCMLNVSACEESNNNITIKHYGRCEVVKECPEGPFVLSESNKTFMIFQNKSIGWESAKEKCETESLDMAHPSDLAAVKLRKHLLELCGDFPVWLDGKADGSKFVWQDTSTELIKKHPLWLVGDPTSILDIEWHYLDKRVTKYHCLALAVWYKDWSQRPTHVYASSLCSTRYYTLCT